MNRQVRRLPLSVRFWRLTPTPIRTFIGNRYWRLSKSYGTKAAKYMQWAQVLAPKPPKS